MNASRFTHIETVYIDSPTLLQKVLQELSGAPQVFLDLEADSMHHYYAKICLMQLLVNNKCFLIDPLSPLKLDDFLEVLSKKPLILHGADYDLRMLYQQHGFRPFKVFDTMLAAQLLGKNAFGLAALVQNYFGVSLKKDQQKADWSLRPLPPTMLEYGAQDTFYLPELYERLTQELVEKNRLEWHDESCSELIKATAHSKEVDLENSWRIDGSFRLVPRQLCILRELWLWRDTLARKLDLPSFKVLPSDLLLRTAMAISTGEPEYLPPLPSRIPQDHKISFRATLDSACLIPKEEWPHPLRIYKKPTKSPNSLLLAHLKQVRDERATELGLEPSLLANKAVLTAVALTGCTSSEKIRESARWMKWQENLLLEGWLRPDLSTFRPSNDPPSP